MPTIPRAERPDYATLALPPAPRDRPYVLVNMVMSADGKAVIEDTERGLGSEVDRRLMRELRAAADVVLTGAGTLRASGATSRVHDADLAELRTARGRPPNPVAAVRSRSGDLPLDAEFFTAEDFEAYVYLAKEAPAGRRRALEATGRPVVVLDGEDETAAMFRHMRTSLRAEVALVEGGPTLNAELFSRGLVDEYFVTVGPVVVGGAETLTPVEGSHTPTLDSVTRLMLISAVRNADTGELYLRYRTLAGARAGP